MCRQSTMVILVVVSVLNMAYAEINPESIDEEMFETLGKTKFQESLEKVIF